MFLNVDIYNIFSTSNIFRPTVMFDVYFSEIMNEYWNKFRKTEYVNIFFKKNTMWYIIKALDLRLFHYLRLWCRNELVTAGFLKGKRTHYKMHKRITWNFLCLLLGAGHLPTREDVFSESREDRFCSWIHAKLEVGLQDNILFTYSHKFHLCGYSNQVQPLTYYITIL